MSFLPDRFGPARTAADDQVHQSADPADNLGEK